MKKRWPCVTSFYHSILKQICCCFFLFLLVVSPLYWFTTTPRNMSLILFSGKFMRSDQKMKRMYYCFISNQLRNISLISHISMQKAFLWRIFLGRKMVVCEENHLNQYIEEVVRKISRGLFDCWKTSFNAHWANTLNRLSSCRLYILWGAYYSDNAFAGLFSKYAKMIIVLDIFNL